MSLDEFLNIVKTGGKVSFQDAIAVVAEHYHYRPTRFVNGGVVNEPGSNEGSCKLLYFAKLHGLSPEQALALFGDYYWQDVLGRPAGTNHANIRAFMRQGWDGLVYDGEALVLK